MEERRPAYTTKSETRLSSYMVAAMFAFVVLTFGILDHYSISLGDDYGYMFTDTRLHGGDGERVATVADCWETQINHYQTTNGRFIVHLLTQIFVNLTPPWVYKVLNAIVFGLVWLFLCRLGACRATFGFSRGVTTWAALWLLMPKPGLIMLSLVAFSLNYMWSGAACLAFMWYYVKADKLRGGYEFVLACLLAFTAGFSQESYSIPLAGALVLVPLLSRTRPSHKQYITGALFLFGTLLCAVAPGNANHLQQGGGLQAAGLMHKVTHMLASLMLTPVPWLALSLLIFGLVQQRKCAAFIKGNVLFVAAICIGLAFDAITFTATRQLYSVSFFSLVLLFRLPVWDSRFIGKYGKQSSITLALTTCTILGGALILRQNTFHQYQELLERTQANASAANGAKYMTWTDVRLASYNRYPQLWQLLGSYAPDPWERSEFYIPFNRQVRRIMSRRFTPGAKPKALIATLPLPPGEIIKIAQRADTLQLDTRYALTAIPKTEAGKPVTNREGFVSGDSIYYVIPIDHE